MRLQSDLALPYPVIAEGRDDFIDSYYQVEIEKKLSNRDVKITLNHVVSEYKVEKLIKYSDKEELSFVTIVKCRSTFFKKAFFSQESLQEIIIDSSELRDRVDIETYICVSKDVSISISKLNDEYMIKSVDYKSGDVVAIGPIDAFAIDPDAFKPLESVFRIVLVEDLIDGDWELDTDEDKLTIRASKPVHDYESEFQYNYKGKAFLKNSIYYAAVVEAIQVLKDDNVNESLKWVKAFKHRMLNLSISDEDLSKLSGYKIANQLLVYPILDFKKINIE